MVETWQVVAAGIPVFLTAAGVMGKLILDNRDQITLLSTRLLGHPEDETDDGFIPETEGRLDQMEGKIESHAETTHSQLRHIDHKVDTLVDVVAGEHEVDADDLTRDPPRDDFFRGGGSSSDDD